MKKKRVVGLVFAISLALCACAGNTQMQVEEWETIESANVNAVPDESYVLKAGEYLYYGTNQTGPMGDAGSVEGKIESNVSRGEIPVQNGQANFETVDSSYTFDSGNGARQVLVNDNYYWFYMKGEDYIKRIAGSWKMDGEKTNQELANNSKSLQDLFGTGLQSGAGIEIGEDGSFHYFIGIGIGGLGKCSYERGMVTADIVPFENVTEETKETKQVYLTIVDGQEYLVMEYDEDKLYWVRN